MRKAISLIVGMLSLAFTGMYAQNDGIRRNITPVSPNHL